MAREDLDAQYGAGAEAADAAAQRQVTILDQIVQEREHQQTRWGDGFDDKNTPADWAAHVNHYMGRATDLRANSDLQRQGMLKAAAILVAAVEAFDRNGGFPPAHHSQDFRGTRD